MRLILKNMSYLVKFALFDHSHISDYHKIGREKMPTLMPEELILVRRLPPVPLPVGDGAGSSAPPAPLQQCRPLFFLFPSLDAR